MIRSVLVGTGILVVIYLVVSNATDAGNLLTTAGGAYSGVVKTLQGR